MEWIVVEQSRFQFRNRAGNRTDMAAIAFIREPRAFGPGSATISKSPGPSLQSKFRTSSRQFRIPANRALRAMNDVMRLMRECIQIECPDGVCERACIAGETYALEDRRSDGNQHPRGSGTSGGPWNRPRPPKVFSRTPVRSDSLSDGKQGNPSTALVPGVNTGPIDGRHPSVFTSSQG